MEKYIAEDLSEAMNLAVSKEDEKKSEKKSEKKKFPFQKKTSTAGGQDTSKGR